MSNDETITVLGAGGTMGLPMSRNLARAVAGCALDLPYLQMKGKAMIARGFEPSFSLALEACAVEHGDRDMSATFLTSAREAR